MIGVGSVRMDLVMFVVVVEYLSRCVFATVLSSCHIEDIYPHQDWPGGEGLVVVYVLAVVVVVVVDMYRV